MPPSVLGSVLGSNSAKIVARLEELNTLAAPVGTQPFGPLDKELAVDPGNISLFDQTLTVGASTQASLAILAPDHEIEAFAGEEGVTAPAGRSYAELNLGGKTTLAGEATSQAAAPFAFTLGLDAGAEFEYRHLLPVAPGQSRLDAFRSVIFGSGVPHRVDLSRLAPGEIHELTALIHMDLKMKLEAGGDASFVGDLFQGLPSQVRFHVEYTANASLGLSLYERLRITTGRAFLLEPDWVRVRVERERKRQLTLGASFSLQVNYDLTQGLESLLEQALDLLPLPRMMATLEQVRTVVKQVENGDWSAIKAKLADRAQAEVTELLGDAGWLDWLAEDPKVNQFLDFSRRAVKAYDELDERLQSLWNRLLGRAGLEAGSKTRDLLEKLKALDPQNPEALLTEQQRGLIEAVETLSGRSLEEILLASGVSPALQEVRDLASKGLDFLDNAPQELFARLESFADRTGIKKAVDWLRANATSVEQIQNAAGAQVRSLVERLTGRVLDQVSQQDVDRVQQWAQRIGTVLDAPQEIEAKLRSRIERLKGEAGFSVAVELDRLSRTTAVLDLEFDPRDGDTRQAVGRIAQSDLGAVLRDLPAGKAQPDGAETFPYRIRECVFTSRRVRTTAVNLFFSFFGWNKSRRQQIEEVTLKVTQDGGNFAREGVYAAAGVLTSESDGVTASGAFWLTSRANGTGRDLEAPYESLGREIRLTYSREDSKSMPEELDGLGVLLNNLGFNVSSQDVRGLVLGQGAGEPTATRFSLDLRLPEIGVDRFWGDLDQDPEEDLWAFDFVNAMHRWFNERLMPDQIPLGGAQRPTGLVLARSLRAPEIHDAWVRGRNDLDRTAINTTLSTSFDGHIIQFRLAVRRPNGDADWKTLVVLPISRSHYGNALRPLGDTARQLAQRSLRPADLAALNRTAGKGILATQPSPGFWGNPMLGVWLVTSRLSRRAPEALQQAKGIATLRWKDAAGEWNPDNLKTWTLESGILVQSRNGSSALFPIVRT